MLSVGVSPHIDCRWSFCCRFIYFWEDKETI